MRCFLIVFFVFSCINAAEISLTPEEKRFIRDNETIVLGIDETLKPFVLTQPEGEVTGFEAQVLKRVNEITGANFVLKPCEIGKLRDQAAEGRIHGLASYTPSNQQQSPFILTQSYLQMQKLVLAASDNAYTMQDRSSLKGKTVAVYRHNLLDKKLAAQLENAAIKEFDTLKDTISSVVTQETDVMFSNGSVFHITNEMGLPSLTPVYRFDTLASHHYALNKAFSPAASILDKALQVMDKEELLALKNRWFSKSLTSSLAKQHRRLVLNFEEKEDLIGRDAIKMCRENIQNPAYEKYLGVNSELIEEVERLLLKNFEPVKTEDMAQSFSYLNQDRCDVVSTVQTARLDNDDVLFSKPYLEIPIVLATQSDRSSIVDINYLKDFKVAVVKHRGIVSNVLSGYENLKVYETKSLSEAFAMVTSKKADAVVGALGVLSEYIKLHSYDFKINGTFNEKLYLAFAVSKDDAIMRGTLNKTIDNISKSKKDEIMNRWFGVRYEKGIDYTVVWLVAAPLAVALLFYIVRIYDLKRINKGLQGVIKKELETSRKKDNLIFQQNKLAATGELITTIAHQWKQPLSELGMSQNLLMTKIENNNVSHSQLMQELYEQQRIVSFMSKTINTFKNFFDDDGNMYAVTSFTVDEAYKDIGFLIAESLKLSEIRLKEDIDSELTVKGSKNALSQVFLSIIHNSIFFLNAREIKDPFISVSIWRQGQHVHIDISDNAKGVEPKRLDKIFDFNYSYRDEKKRSTGLGLYICKMIVHESFKGKITAANGQEGLRISITLPVHIRY